MSGIWRVILLSSAVLIGTQTGFAQDINGVEDADDIADALAIGKIGYGGSGCKQGTVKAALIDSDHNNRPTRLRLNFADYEVTKAGRESCAIRLTVDQPRGWQFAILSARFAGKAHLPAGTAAKVESLVNFPGLAGSAILQATINGPYDAAYTRGDALDNKDLVWSKCGVGAPLLGLNTYLTLAGAKSKPASVSSTRQTYWLHWRQCK